MSKEPERPRARRAGLIVGLILAVPAGYYCYTLLPQLDRARPAATADAAAIVGGKAGAPATATQPAAASGKPGSAAAAAPGAPPPPAELPPGVEARLRPGWEYLPGTKDTIVVAREVLIRFKSTPSSEELIRFNQDHHVFIANETAAGIRVVLSEGTAVVDGLEKLRADPRLASVEPRVITPEIEASFPKRP